MRTNLLNSSALLKQLVLLFTTVIIYWFINKRAESVVIARAGRKCGGHFMGGWKEH